MPFIAVPTRTARVAHLNAGCVQLKNALGVKEVTSLIAELKRMRTCKTCGEVSNVGL